MLLDADLLLTGTRKQTAACVVLAPARRTFTLRKFARFAAELPLATIGDMPSRPRALVDTINATRHTIPFVKGNEDDLPDLVNMKTGSAPA